MKNYTKALGGWLLVIVPMVLLLAGMARADNITVYDGDGYMGLAQGGEDRETEPGNRNDQTWDLEAVIWTPPVTTGGIGQLVMIGGWDFVDGTAGYPWQSGDLFLCFNNAGPLRNGPGADGSWEYDRVFDLNWPAIGGSTASGTLIGYNLMDVSGSGIFLSTVGLSQNRPESGPYRWVSGGTSLSSGTALYQTYATNALVNAAFASDLAGANALVGGMHYSLTFDYLPQGDGFWTHFTQGCGNDNLMGKVEFPPVPEPTTLVLLGLSVAGILARKRFLA